MTSMKRREARSAGTKRAVNLTVEAALLDEARDAGTNISAVLEAALERELADYRLQKSRVQNRDAIEDYNRFIAENGLLSDTWRKF